MYVKWFMDVCIDYRLTFTLSYDKQKALSDRREENLAHSKLL